MKLFSAAFNNYQTTKLIWLISLVVSVSLPIWAIVSIITSAAIVIIMIIIIPVIVTIAIVVVAMIMTIIPVIIVIAIIPLIVIMVIVVVSAVIAISSASKVLVIIEASLHILHLEHRWLDLSRARMHGHEVRIILSVAVTQLRVQFTQEVPLFLC